jgi:phosphoglycerate dehydrogenase-like enzyme
MSPRNMHDQLKVLFHYAAGQELQARVEQFSELGLKVICCPEGADASIYQELEDTEIFWHVLQPVTKEIIAHAPKLKLIQKLGVGVNTIDLVAARERNIAVCNMPGTNSQAVAEMTLFLMLGALRKYPRLDHACRSGEWRLDTTTKNSLGEIRGRTVGFVGFGAVPRILAPILQAMGARVIYYTRQPKADPYEYASVESLLAQSDIVTLHLPLTAETDGLINRSNLALMKPGAVLINTARGELVDEDALYDALSNGHLSAAGLDVFRQEPVPAQNSLLSLDNVMVTPHTAWLTNETLARCLEVAVRNSLAIMHGNEPEHRVA